MKFYLKTKEGKSIAVIFVNSDLYKSEYSPLPICLNIHMIVNINIKNYSKFLLNLENEEERNQFMYYMDKLNNMIGYNDVFKLVQDIKSILHLLYKNFQIQSQEEIEIKGDVKFNEE